MINMLNDEILPTLVQLFPDQFNNGYFRRLRWIQYGAQAYRLREFNHRLE